MEEKDIVPSFWHTDCDMLQWLEGQLGQIRSGFAFYQ